LFADAVLHVVNPRAGVFDFVLLGGFSRVDVVSLTVAFLKFQTVTNREIYRVITYTVEEGSIVLVAVGVVSLALACEAAG